MERFGTIDVLINNAGYGYRAAVEEGIVPGGGTALIRVSKVLDSIKPADDDELAGVNIIRNAIEAPLRQIAHNAGFEGSIVVEKVRQGKDGFGFNAATGEYEDLIKARRHRPQEGDPYRPADAAPWPPCC